MLAKRRCFLSASCGDRLTKRSAVTFALGQYNTVMHTAGSDSRDSHADSAGDESPSPRGDPPVVSATAASAVDSQLDLQTEQTIRWNFWGLAFYQVILRIGWIFKTESIIMPAVLDSLGCGPAVRAWLPLCNRFGQSVPPLLLSHRVRGASRKKILLSVCSFCMAIAFLVLAACWRWTGGTGAWLPYMFIGIYAMFFLVTGIHQLCFGALQGKLVPVRRRGRLLMAASILGSSLACLIAALLLPRWLSGVGARFDLIFAFTGVCFLVASAVAITFDEFPDNFGRPATTLAKILDGARQVWRQSANTRRLAIVAALFGSSVILFPHYQAMARERLGLTFENMMLWVVIQNAGTAMFSFLVGPLADRRGNRIVLLVILAIIGATPLLAVGVSHTGSVWGARMYPLVFLFVGLTPNVFRTFNNYTLEISKPSDHPRFLSTISLFIAGPAILSPLAGLAIAKIGLDPVFVGASLLMFLAWLMAFGLNEPRTIDEV